MQRVRLTRDIWSLDITREDMERQIAYGGVEQIARKNQIAWVVEMDGTLYCHPAPTRPDLDEVLWGGFQHWGPNPPWKEV